MILRRSTAFALTSGRRRPRMKDDAHLAWIRTLPCLITGREGAEGCHIRFGSLAHGKPMTGAGMKPDDCWVVPMTPEMHRKQHAMSEPNFWANHGIDVLYVAALLYLASGDDERGRLIIQHARELTP